MNEKSPEERIEMDSVFWNNSICERILLMFSSLLNRSIFSSHDTRFVVCTELKETLHSIVTETRFVVCTGVHINVLSSVAQPCCVF